MILLHCNNLHINLGLDFKDTGRLSVSQTRTLHTVMNELETNGIHLKCTSSSTHQLMKLTFCHMRNRFWSVLSAVCYNIENIHVQFLSDD
eukprot:g66029.t1